MQWSTVPGTVLILLSACADSRASDTHQFLQAQVATQSGGALVLSSFSKANGYEQNVGGIELYTVEWEARLDVQSDVWKGGNAFVGYWSDFGVMPSQPDMYSRLLTSSGAKELVRGATVVLTGESHLQKTENGWRVLDAEVKTSQLLNNARSPAALAELQRRQDSARQEQQEVQAAEAQRRAAIAEKEASDVEEARKRREELYLAARGKAAPLGQVECVERVNGVGSAFLTTELRTYRIVVTSAGITREFLRVTARGGSAWSKPTGEQPEVIWFDELAEKPGYYRGSRSRLDRVISLKSDRVGEVSLYCSGDQETRIAADHLESTFKLLETAIDSWRAQYPALARW
jgi:hypothetical protein